MSNTKRKDLIDHYVPRGYISFVGEFVDTTPTKKELIKAHADGKKSYKPGRKAKKYLNKGAKAVIKRKIQSVIADPDAGEMPKLKKNHVWYYN